MKTVFNWVGLGALEALVIFLVAVGIYSLLFGKDNHTLINTRLQCSIELASKGTETHARFRNYVFLLGEGSSRETVTEVAQMVVSDCTVRRLTGEK